MVIINLPFDRADGGAAGDRVARNFKPSKSVEKYVREALGSGYAPWLITLIANEIRFEIDGREVFPDAVPSDGSTVTARRR